MLAEDMSSATQHSIDGPSQAPDHGCVGHRKSSSQGKFLRSLSPRQTVWLLLWYPKGSTSVGVPPQIIAYACRQRL